MVTVTVDRMRTRYIGDAVRFDGHLRRMLDEELAPALRAVSLPDGHVCLRRLSVPVRLGPSGAARSWADQIAAALARALHAGDDVVIFPRTLDALTDVLVSIGRGDTSRAWAWRQLGLLSADPHHPDAAATALLRRPDLACAALAAAAPHAPLPLTVTGWAALAQAVADLVAWPAADDGPPPEVVAEAVLDAPVARRRPARIAELPPDELRAVAQLLLLCAAPSLSRSGRMIAAVTDLLRRPHTTRPGYAPAPGEAEPAARSAGMIDAGRVAPDPDVRDRAVPDRAAPDVDMPEEDVPERAVPARAAGPDGRSEPGPRDRTTVRTSGTRAASAPEATPSHAAGVLFLIACTGVPELRPGSCPPLAPDARNAARLGPLADRPLSMVVGWLAAHLGDVDTDDPAVHVLAGQPQQAPDQPVPTEDAALADLAEDVRTWLRNLLRLEPADDLRWLWQRPARIVAEPGWVEVTYSLEDVDTRVRAAGLDLDPGFVWWLGAAVRYHYE
ncbi:hypothetical protein ACWDWO_13550 [Actinopolymorpha singaporensis]